MIPRDDVRDFIHRTFVNLQYIESSNNAQDDSLTVYEVTQLVNSLVGLLVVPQQRFYNQINNNYVNATTLQRLISCICENNYKTQSGSDEIVDLNSILRHMRNSVCHDNFNFLNAQKQSTPFSEIKFISFKDTRKIKQPDGSKLNCRYRIDIDLVLLKKLLSDLSSNF